MPSSLSIRVFDPTSIKREKNGKIARKLAFIGGSGRGKTTGMLGIISHLAPEIDLCILMCPTETTRNIFRARGLPESLIYPGLDLECIAALLAVQRENKERGKMRSILLCLDDVSYDRKCLNDPCIRELMYNQRHLNVCTLISAQFCYDLPPCCRSNLDYIFCTGDSAFSNVKRLHASYFGIFRTIQEFHRVFQATTQDFSLCVADCTQMAESPSDQVFWYRAPKKVPKFTIGSPVYQKLEAKRQLQLKQAENDPNRPVVVPTTTDKPQRTLVDAI
jgi:hypothetical protein